MITCLNSSSRPWKNQRHSLISAGISTIGLTTVVSTAGCTKQFLPVFRECLLRRHCRFYSKANPCCSKFTHTLHSMLMSQSQSQMSYHLCSLVCPFDQCSRWRLRYHNLFNAMGHSAYAAMEKVGDPMLESGSPRTGWLPAGSGAATISNARAYNNNLIAQVLSGNGTPSRQGKPLEADLLLCSMKISSLGKLLRRALGSSILTCGLCTQFCYGNFSNLWVLLQNSGAQSIGVCYGLVADNLPSPSEVVDMYHDNGIISLRLYDPNPGALNSLRHSGINVALGVRNEDIQAIASSAAAADHWISLSVKPYASSVSIKYVTVGNEIIPGPLAQFVLPAMKNLHNSLMAAGLGIVGVTTVVSMPVLGNSYPPSQGTFSPDVVSVMASIVSLLNATGRPLLANVYPYFSYANDPVHIPLSYALFTSSAPVVHDGQFLYQNLFDAMVDALHAAMEKVGGAGVRVVVSESGWPSEGAGPATITNAETYNNNLIAHVLSGKGTPRRPRKPLEAFVFAMFNENLKPGGQPAVGVCYDTQADNLPPGKEVLPLFESSGITSVRRFRPDSQMLDALQYTRITVALGVDNSEVQLLGTSKEAASAWIYAHIQSYHRSVTIKYIIVGNELIPGPLSPYVLTAMENLDDMLSRHSINSISVTTTVLMDVLTYVYTPPSQAFFSSSSVDFMSSLLSFLDSRGYPLFVNVYPFLVYYATGKIPLPYAQFTSPVPVVTDGSFSYLNLLDQMVDSLYVAMEKVGQTNVTLAIAETGWPSAGVSGASVGDASIYNNNFVAHVLSSKGTPRRPNTPLEAFVYNMFNEDWRSGVFANFGLFYPDKNPVYPVQFDKAIAAMRLYEPNTDALTALKGSSIEVMLGVRNEDLASIAGSQSAADDWVHTNVAAYSDVKIKYITAGNEVIPCPNSQYVLPAMQK
ncbi:Glucan endo-1-3-beta-glucosidase basic isoform [Nymphaea thermarum]|nr:Glucan endo-1-3-beta-glucosidase basic isoform [Nymphaea thermarum]